MCINAAPPQSAGLVIRNFALSLELSNRETLRDANNLLRAPLAIKRPASGSVQWKSHGDVQHRSRKWRLGDFSQRLAMLARAEAGCKRCPLYKDAIQVVAGEGPAGADFMLVGEQPGDKEDLAGKPFVGPAGKVLDLALKDAGIDRDDVFVTNAVKHVKHEMRGKRRLHKRPNSYEIESCRTWIDREWELIKPSIIVALGVTAARSLIGKSVTISGARKAPMSLADGTVLVVTVHPSSLLRIQDEEDKRSAYEGFVADLKAARAILRNAKTRSSG